MSTKLCSLVGFFFLLAAPLFAAEFTADSRVVTHSKTAESKLYHADDMWRIEEHPSKGEYRVTIFRQDKKSLYVLWPDKKRYIVQPLPEKEFQIISTRKPGEELERTELGQEKISGYLTTKYLVKYSVQGRMITSIEWFSKDLGVVLRSHAEDNSWSSEISNIKEDKLDSKLFDIPAGYQELSFKDVFKGPKPR